MTHKHAEIAGAGFAGLTAAIALRARGWTVRVHEKASELRSFGAGIYIWENGLRVLAAIGAYEDVVSGAHRPPAYETRRDGKMVSKETFDDSCRLMIMTREHLHLSLAGRAEAVGVDIVTNSSVTGARPEGVLLTEDGREWPADLVVGADGVRSPVRDSLGLLDKREIYSDGITRLLVPRMRERLGPGDWDNVIDFWVTVPRTLRILYSPCNDRDLYLALLAPEDNPAAARIPVDKQLWMEAFPQLQPAIAQIGSQGRRDPYETSILKAWSKGKVAVIGDAAHAMSPPLAQGGGCAMMNGLSLAAFVDGVAQVDEALARWEAQERPLTDRTQLRSAHYAKTRQMATGNQWQGEIMETAMHRPTGTQRTAIRSPMKRK
ncbi:MAG: FAD-dependent oxidoreductase [Rhizobiaceae bacterium]